MAKIKVKEVKQKKKKWFNLIAPKQFNEVVVGETPAIDASTLVGKTVTLSLMNLTKDVRKQNINVRLKVNEVKDNKAHSELDTFTMNSSAIKRLVRRRKDRVDDSFVAISNDDRRVRVKPMVLTRSNTNQSVLSAIRRYIKVFLVNKVNNMTYAEFVEYVVTDKFHRDVKKQIAKIYPVKLCIIRAFNLEANLKAPVVKLTEEDLALLTAAEKKLEAKTEKVEAPAKEEAKEEKKTEE